MLRAVRAVDTATDPDYQGRGLFTRLTLQAIDELRAEGVDFVFNTPNDQSRPGYLKMGWQVVGTLPTHVRPTRWRNVAAHRPGAAPRRAVEHAEHRRPRLRVTWSPRRPRSAAARGPRSGRRRSAPT